MALHLCLAGGYFPGSDASSLPWQRPCVSTHVRETRALYWLWKQCFPHLGSGTSTLTSWGGVYALQEEMLKSRKEGSCVFLGMGVPVPPVLGGGWYRWRAPFLCSLQVLSAGWHVPSEGSGGLYSLTPLCSVNIICRALNGYIRSPMSTHPQ